MNLSLRQVLFPVLFGCFFFCSVTGYSQSTLKVMHYNVLRFGECNGVTLAQKDEWMRIIAESYQPDILTINEMLNRLAFANRIKVRALQYANMEVTNFKNEEGGDIVNMLFYNKDKLGYLGLERVPELPGTDHVRDIDAHRLFDRASVADGSRDTVFLVCIVSHFKAGGSSSDQRTREAMADAIMDYISRQSGADENYLVMGDFNVGSSNEAAYRNMVDFLNPIHRLIDPLGSGPWGRNNPSVFTQSTRTSSSDCGVAGGMDDRFDFILASRAIMEGRQDLEYVSGSYSAYGNDGNTSYNGPLNCTGSNPVGFNVCSALIQMSDHLPVVMELNRLRATGRSSAYELRGVRMNTMSSTGNNLDISLRFDEVTGESLTLKVVDLVGRTVAVEQVEVHSTAQKLSLFPCHMWPLGCCCFNYQMGLAASLRKKFAGKHFLHRPFSCVYSPM
ncbi:MAG: endonuclease/exonuclease/phosphatase family protein [Bacteroidota bacterium]